MSVSNYFLNSPVIFLIIISMMLLPVILSGRANKEFAEAAASFIGTIIMSPLIIIPLFMILLFINIFV